VLKGTFKGRKFRFKIVSQRNVNLDEIESIIFVFYKNYLKQTKFVVNIFKLLIKNLVSLDVRTFNKK
jgi:hypothetical protein